MLKLRFALTSIVAMVLASGAQPLAHAFTVHADQTLTRAVTLAKDHADLAKAGSSSAYTSNLTATICDTSGGSSCGVTINSSGGVDVGPGGGGGGGGPGGIGIDPGVTCEDGYQNCAGQCISMAEVCGGGQEK